MDVKGFTFLEYTRADRRSPNIQSARDSSTVERWLRQVRPGGLLPQDYDDGRAALLGWATVRSQADDNGDGYTRRWIERTLPHSVTPLAGGDYNDSNMPVHLWASSVEECSPTTGHVTSTGTADAPMPASLSMDYRVRYQTFPYMHRPDGRHTLDPVNPGGDTPGVGNNVLAVLEGDGTGLGSPRPAGWDNPLAAMKGVGSGDYWAGSKPDEGDALRRGWRYTRFVARKVTDTSRWITLPNGLAKWVGTDTAVPTGLPFLQPRSRVQYTWVQVPLDAIPFNAIARNRGRTNGVEFDGFQAETMIFDGFDWTLYQGVGNRWYADVLYSFTYLPNRDQVTNTYNGPNAFPRVLAGRFRYALYNASGFDNDTDYVYQKGNFSSLFRPDQTLPAIVDPGEY